MTPGEAAGGRSRSGGPSGRKRRNVRLRATHIGLAALSGALATVAFWQAPWSAAIPPLIYPPWIPVDLRFLLGPLGFAGAHLITARSRWPAPAVALPLTAVLSAVASHLHASAALDFAGVAWAAPGVRVGLIGVAGSVASVLVALLVALQVARDRFLEQAREAGVPEAGLAPAREHAGRLTEAALATAAVAAAVLALALRLVDEFLGGSRLPLPELFALAVVLALGVVFLGWRSQPSY